MNKKQFKKKFLGFGTSFLVCFLAAGLFLSVGGIPGHKEFKTYLTKQLTRVEPLRHTSHKVSSRSNSVIYVLGGSQESLKARFETAAQLAHQGFSKRILLLSEPGITEFDPSLSRNLTNDDWAIKQLTGLGIKKEDTELVSLKKGFFGTLSEARDISEIASKRGYKRLILVTSQYHTKRTWITFSKMFENRNITLSIYAANDPVRLRSLLYEYLKLVLYKNIVLPYYAEQKPAAASGVMHIATSL